MNSAINLLLKYHQTSSANVLKVGDMRSSVLQKCIMKKIVVLVRNKKNTILLIFYGLIIKCDLFII